MVEKWRGIVLRAYFERLLDHRRDLCQVGTCGFS
jgi:hypothetical protein